MHLTFEEAIGYMGVWIFVCGMILSLIVGLYYLAELVEEHLKTTKKVIIHCIQGLVPVLLLLWALHGVDAATMLPTVGAPLCYLRVVSKSFPYLSFKDPLMILGSVLTVASHVMWMRYHMSTFHHISVVLGFFLLVVWLIPFMILISLAANENALPGASSGMPLSMVGGGGGGSAGGAAGEGGARRERQKRTWVTSLLQSLSGPPTAGPRGKDHSW
ncbi:hypothetical protein HYH03_002544 [Edaphochlamys debaryana]|uniref:Protein TEX261 n=1 Tax=Edaphochlamys debaryana TaxID=47281 RepID=A0A836C546_9CHLO|nr:hypothetical protein HYH03_002544 [Edaphochlamys debaryana]|eukprot:KAG2499603.1 hypothetical protein HYH03_002544 [Edaphochlamys debaryana]